MAIAYIGFGSNIGDRVANLNEALKRLMAEPEITVEARSSLYETAPVGLIDQPDFINAVVRVQTALLPLELLAVCKRIESELGRQPGPRWSPRLIDLDLLLYNNLTLEAPGLKLPHPQITNRAFVLVPLAEIAGDVRHPNGKTIRQLLDDQGVVKGVTRYGPWD